MSQMAAAFSFSILPSRRRIGICRRFGALDREGRAFITGAANSIAEMYFI
jgi:hypothetical protein